MSPIISQFIHPVGLSLCIHTLVPNQVSIWSTWFHRPPQLEQIFSSYYIFYTHTPAHTEMHIHCERKTEKEMLLPNEVTFTFFLMKQTIISWTSYIWITSGSLASVKTHAGCCFISDSGKAVFLFIFMYVRLIKRNSCSYVRQWDVV